MSILSLFLTFILLSINVLARAQDDSWMLLNQSKGLLRMEKSDVDAEGNLYVSGRLSGYTEFVSAQKKDTSIIDSLTYYQHNAFMLKYSSNGALEYFLKISGLSSNDLPYIYHLKCLSDGDLAMIIHCGSGFVIQTKDSILQISHVWYQNHLLRLGKKGEIKLFRSIGGEKHLLTADQQGNAIVFFRAYLNELNRIVRIEKDGLERGIIYTGKIEPWEIYFSRIRSGCIRQTTNYQ